MVWENERIKKDREADAEKWRIRIKAAQQLCFAKGLPIPSNDLLYRDLGIDNSMFSCQENFDEDVINAKLDKNWTDKEHKVISVKEVMMVTDSMLNKEID
mmetsp:Transcript_2669/g.4735  ORF Transcript_2669/g.4735 Transcript_2669/m.4735 type:complete len:100 (+) Transcript_2669:277-576(+)